MKKTLLFSVIAFLTLSLVFISGCSEKTSRTSAGDLKDGQTINVAVSGTFPPFSVIGKTGSPEGFDYHR